ncbi:hypothetical protein FS837_002737, partial [Tulasnella sp. UAMH 9824]
MHVVYPNTTAGAGCRFTLSPAQEILDIPNGMDSYSTTLCAWGETGRRMVHVGDFGELCVVGLSVPVGFGAERFAVPVEDRCVASWKIPYSRRDFARYLAFDEATGVCAVALASGRIWIADPARRTVFKDANAAIKKIKFKNPPHPDPAWTSGRRKPWPGDVDHSSASRNVLLPRMSAKVHSWFPGKNDPNAFGSVTWFVNEALHISGPATVVLFGTPRRLLCIERDDDMASYNIKLLDKGVELEAVITHMKGGRLLCDLPGQKVAVDGFILNVTGLRDEDVPLKEIEFRNPPHPDPAWRFIPRKPWAGEPGHPSRLQDALLLPMATKIYRWFPGKNNPQAFGSAKWFVNEVLHIPGPATVLLVGTPQDSFEIIDLRGKLLLIERDDDMALYRIKLLDAKVTFESVVAHLKGGGFLRDLPGIR